MTFVVVVPGRDEGGQWAAEGGGSEEDGAQKLSDEQPQQEKPSTESQNITPGQERDDDGAPVELALQKTGGTRRDGPDVKRKFLTNLEPSKMPEVGMLLI
ncbi:P antigen family member 3-like [Equus asinus]|uniref:P antigen family member 3-like n=1 Tax=Equus asinus TaxID=9793 RepID=UPI0038F70450